jgi:DNA-directed RNA polymerase specialized sigma subunit
MSKPIEKVLDAFYATTGRKPTGHGPYNVACPCHGDRKKSVVVREDSDGSVVIFCYVCGDSRAVKEQILGAVGLEFQDLYETQNRRSAQEFHGKSGGADIDSSPDWHLEGLNASSKRLYSALKEHSQTLPPALKAGWQQALNPDEFQSLVWLVRERLGRRSQRELNFDALLYAAFEAAVAAHQVGEFDPSRAKLTTYAKPSIRGAIRDEVTRQTGREDELPLVDEDNQIPDQVPEVFGLEVSDLPSTCELCNEPISRDKPSDTRFCTDAHRYKYHYLKKQEAEDYAEAIEFQYAALPPLPPDANRDWVFERALLREAVNELSQRRRYWRRLEEWLLSIWDSRVSSERQRANASGMREHPGGKLSLPSSTFNDLKDWRSRVIDNRHHQTRELMRPSDHDHHRRRP